MTEASLRDGARASRCLGQKFPNKHFQTELNPNIRPSYISYNNEAILLEILFHSSRTVLMATQAFRGLQGQLQHQISVPKISSSFDTPVLLQPTLTTPRSVSISA